MVRGRMQSSQRFFVGQKPFLRDASFTQRRPGTRYACWTDYGPCLTGDRAVAGSAGLRRGRRVNKLHNASPGCDAAGGNPPRAREAATPATRGAAAIPAGRPRPARSPGESAALPPRRDPSTRVRGGRGCAASLGWVDAARGRRRLRAATLLGRTAWRR